MILMLADVWSADITPTFKEADHLLKNNYRPISILLTVPNIYEKIFYKQICEFFNSIFSKYLFGIKKGHNTHCLLYVRKHQKKFG